MPRGLRCVEARVGRPHSECKPASRQNRDRTRQRVESVDRAGVEPADGDLQSASTRTGARLSACHTQLVADTPRRTNEKPLKLPDDFEQTMRDLLATGPNPKDDATGTPDADTARDDKAAEKLS